MDNDRGALKLLKWVGLVALVSLPLVVFLKKRKPEGRDVYKEDDSDIFSSELKE